MTQYALELLKVHNYVLLNVGLTQLAMEAIKCDAEHKASRLEQSLHYSWNKLCPGSQHLRRYNVSNERRDYKAKAQILNNLSGKWWTTITCVKIVSPLPL